MINQQPRMETMRRFPPLQATKLAVNKQCSQVNSAPMTASRHRCADNDDAMHNPVSIATVVVDPSPWDDTGVPRRVTGTRRAPYTKYERVLPRTPTTLFLPSATGALPVSGQSHAPVVVLALGQIAFDATAGYVAWLCVQVFHVTPLSVRPHIFASRQGKTTGLWFITVRGVDVPAWETEMNTKVRGITKRIRKRN